MLLLFTFSLLLALLVSFYMYWVFTCTTCMLSAHRGQTRASDPLWLELFMAMTTCELLCGARNQTRIFWKNSQVLWTVEPSFQPPPPSFLTQGLNMLPTLAFRLVFAFSKTKTKIPESWECSSEVCAQWTHCPAFKPQNGYHHKPPPPPLRLIASKFRTNFSRCSHLG